MNWERYFRYAFGVGGSPASLVRYDLKRLRFQLDRLDYAFDRESKSMTRSAARRVLRLARNIASNDHIIDAAWWDFDNQKWLPKTPKRIVKAHEKWKKENE